MSDNSAFLNAIRAAANANLPKPKQPEVKPAQPAKQPAPTVRQDWPEANIEFNLSGNTCTIAFSDKLSDGEQTIIKSYGYLYSDRLKVWLNDYSDKAVEFLNERLGENLDLPSKVRASQQTAPIAPAVIPDETFSDESEAYTKYKKQVDALIVKLNMHPADLMLAAIDCMYKIEFPQ